MIKLLSTLVLAVVSYHSANSQAKYDAHLADSLGADSYGMKTYILVMLKTGPNKINDKQKSDSIFQLHMSNMGKMAENHQLIVAGPMKTNEKQYRGLFVLNVKTIEDARLLLRDDAAVREGLLDAEYYEWYGSAALPMYLPYHEKVQKTQF